MESNAYEELAQWLSTTFRALPGVNVAEFKDLIHFLYTPEEAQLAVQMGWEGGTLDELVNKTGTPKEELRQLIRSMEKKGTIYTPPDCENPKYHAFGVESPGLFETTAGWADFNTPFGRKALELWGKVKPIYVNEGIAPLGKHAKVWCMATALPPDAKPEENLFALIKEDVYGAVVTCPCRLIEQHVEHGDVCDCINECCMLFGELARWVVQQGHGRHIAYKEVMEILEACEKKGQLHIGVPGKIVCNCCKHACVNLYAQKFGKDHTYFPNHFFAHVDPETCISCGICTERCPVGAMQLETVAEVDLTKCIGCGACATGCEVNAIRMVRRSEEEIAQIDASAMAAFVKVMSMTKMDPMMLK